MSNTAHRASSLCALATLLWGCGGSEATPDPSGASQDFGSVTTRIVGTAAAPVVSSGYGATAVGVAGATFSDITQSHALKSLANTRIAFGSNRNGSAGIYAMHADGSNQIALTAHPTGDFFPAWSPDGARIAFYSFRDGNAEIYVMNADGSGQTRVTSNPASDYSPAWSPDGTRIAFSSSRDGNYEIYSMKADGTGQTRLTNSPSFDSKPSWSPDSTRIVFYSSRDGNYELYTMKADGTALTRLTYSSAAEYVPAWSPEGSRIAYVTDRDGDDEIYTMDADGSNATRVTTNGAYDAQPTWSPDSTRIAFDSIRDGSLDVYVMGFDGSGQTRLTTKPSTDSLPAWSGFWRPKYVGKAGILGASCAGFLLGKQGQASASLLVFDTPVASRAGARISANTDTDTNGPNLVFTLTTTAGMSSLKFVNAAQTFTPVNLALPAGTTGALVLLDSSTGLVTDVVPYAANRGVPTRVRRGDLVTFTGDFSAIFDSVGKNRAPRGARSVTVLESTGRLVGFDPR